MPLDSFFGSQPKLVALPVAFSEQGRLIKPQPRTTASCPECGGQVIAKCGEHRTHHWAHHDLTPCASRSAGTSFKHLLMQYCIINMFDPTGKTDAKLEHRSGNRRADVSITVRNQPFFIEAQVSPINLADMEDRTRDWNQMGYAVLWVFDHKIFTTHSGRTSMATWAFDWAMRRGWHQGYTIDDDARLWWFRVDGPPPNNVAVKLQPLAYDPERKCYSITALGHPNWKVKLISDSLTYRKQDPIQVGAFCWVPNPADQMVTPLGHPQPKWVSLWQQKPTTPPLTPEQAWGQ